MPLLNKEIRLSLFLVTFLLACTSTPQSGSTAAPLGSSSFRDYSSSPGSLLARLHVFRRGTLDGRQAQLSSTQGKAWGPGSASKYYIDIDGSRRYFYATAPSGPLSSQWATLIVLHGGGGSAESAMSTTRLAERSTGLNLNVVFPQAFGYGRMARWDTGLYGATNNKNNSDVHFLDRLTDLYGNGGKPVFLVGLSNGGMMVLNQLCNSSRSYQGAVVVAGGTSYQILNRCNPSARLPIAFVHGEQDSIVPFMGGEVHNRRFRLNDRSTVVPVVSHDQLVSFWRNRNSCSGSAYDRAPILSRYLNPDIRIRNYVMPVKQCLQTLSIDIVNGDHGWPVDSSLSGNGQATRQYGWQFSGVVASRGRLDSGDFDTTGAVLALVGKWGASH